MRLRSKAELAALAALAYGPFLLSDPGRVSADTKQDLYLDPARLLARTTDLWDPHLGAGTVPHQGLGYLVPMGPWFWAFERLGAPDWVAQRLWLGTLSLVALLGARWLFRLLGTGGTGALAGALVYGLTPYQLAFTARMSVILLPWAMLPWLVGLTMRATRTGGWRQPALVALAVLAVGGVSASSLLFVAIGPVLWVVVEVVRRRDRAAVLATAGRIGLLVAGVCAWWVVGLRLQAAYGLPVLQLTENVRTVAEVSTPGDVLRGLGNWFFYGRDQIGWSVDQAGDYASDSLVVALSYAVPVLALAAGLVVRWAHRAFFALLVVVGTVVAVGAWPVDDPTPFGRGWRAFTTDTSVGLAFRNSPRAVPLVVLGLAGLLAAAVGAVRPATWRRVAGSGGAALAVAALLPVWPHGYLTDGMLRPEHLPAHWRAAIARIDAGDHATRVLELPGSSFAAYRWGTTVEPITPGLTDRPYLAREVLPAGTVGTVNLLDAFDRRLQLGTFEPAALGPVARLLGVGTVAFRGDLEQIGRFDTPPSTSVWAALRPVPAGLGRPTVFDDPGAPAGADGPPAVALFDVADPRPTARVAPVDEPVVLAGDGDGIVDSAAAGLLDGRALVLPAAALDDATLSGALDAGAHLVLTDSNRRRIQTWFYSLRDTRGPTEAAGETAEDPTGYDFRLDPFPGTGDDSRTVVERIGGQVQGSGGRGPERPEDRATHAVDGDVTTAWRVAGEVAGQHLHVRFDGAVPVDQLRLVQAAPPPGGRALARVAVRVGDDAPVEVDLGPESLTPAGQVVVVPGRSVQDVTVELLTTTAGAPTTVGLAELRVGDRRVAESVRPPVDLLRRVGERLDGHSLDVVLTRLRLDLPGTDRQDDEATLDRTIELPTARTFGLVATVRSADGAAAPAGGPGCRDDLVRVDGAAVAVQVTATTGAAQTLEACAPLELTAGSHRIEATAGSATGLDVDRLVLSSASDGGPAPIGARGRPAGTAGVELAVTGRSSSTVEADAGGAAGPFWFVLAESASSGWSLHVDGGSAGPRQLVDGYANGWLITPDGTGPVHLQARWEPQRLVWLGLSVSAVAVVACGAVLWRTRRRPAAPVAALAAPPRLLRWPLADGAPPGAGLAAAALVAIVGVLVAPPQAALVAAAVIAATAVIPWPPARLLPAVIAPAALAASRGLERPALAWMAVLVLLGTVLLDAIGRPSTPAGGVRARRSA